VAKYTPDQFFEFLEAGSKKVSQKFGGWYTYSHSFIPALRKSDAESACVLGTVLVEQGLQAMEYMPDESDSISKLNKMFPDLCFVVPSQDMHPVMDNADRANGLSFFSYAIRLNDGFKWSREKIAEELKRLLQLNRERKEKARQIIESVKQNQTVPLPDIISKPVKQREKV